ncbi:hypothetical protein EON63_16315, partial [archaeon]
MMAEIRSSLEALHILLVPPAVTELPACGSEELGGEVAASLLDQVLSSLEALLLSLRELSRPSHEDTVEDMRVTKFHFDSLHSLEGAWDPAVPRNRNSSPLLIRTAPPSPLEIFHVLSLKKHQKLLSQVMDNLLCALQVEVGPDKLKVTFSYQEYLSLLLVHHEHASVITVLEKHHRLVGGAEEEEV